MKSGFHEFAHTISRAVGSHQAFYAALAVVVVWAVSGPFFGYSDTWQLVINTATTLVTFLMVFVIQATQNREAQATQLKLDELIRSKKEARNVFANLEDASEEELEKFEREFKALRKKGLSTRKAMSEAMEHDPAE